MTDNQKATATAEPNTRRPADQRRNRPPYTDRAMYRSWHHSVQSQNLPRKESERQAALEKFSKKFVGDRIAEIRAYAKRLRPGSEKTFLRDETRTMGFYLNEGLPQQALHFWFNGFELEYLYTGGRITLPGQEIGG